MSQFPPGSPFDPAMQPFDPPGEGTTQGNGMAIASLVLGLVGFCTVGIGGLLAIPFGLIGLNKTKDPRVSGKGMAIAGLLLGIFSIVAWAAIIYGFYVLGTQITKTVGEGPKLFLTEISKGDVDAVLARVDPSKVDRAKVEAAVEEAKPWGAFKSLDQNGMESTNDNGLSTMIIRGNANFEKATKSVEIRFSNSQAAPLSWKITGWTLK